MKSKYGLLLVCWMASLGCDAMAHSDQSTEFPKSTETATLNDIMNPIRQKAQGIRLVLDQLKERFKTISKASRASTYEEAIKEAEDKARAFEEASRQHDTLMQQYRRGKIASGHEAVQLAESTFAKEKSLLDILWRIEKMLDPKIDETHAKHELQEALEIESMPLTAKAPPASSYRYVKLQESIIKKSTSEDEEVPTILQPNQSLRRAKLEADHDLDSYKIQ